MKNQYSHFLCSFAVIVGMFVIAPPAIGQQSSASENRIYGIERPVSLVVPDGWMARNKDLPRGVKLFLQSPSEGVGDGYIENVLVNEDRLAASHVLNDFIEWNMAETRRRFEGFRILEDTSTQLSDGPARLVVVQYKIQGVTAVQVNYFLERDRFAYSVTGTTLLSEYGAWEQRLKNVCLTFKFQ